MDETSIITFLLILAINFGTSLYTSTSNIKSKRYIFLIYTHQRNYNISLLCILYTLISQTLVPHFTLTLFHMWHKEVPHPPPQQPWAIWTRGDHSIVKLNTTCGQNKITFGKLHHQNESKFYQFFFMSRYTWYLLHRRKE